MKQKTLFVLFITVLCLCQTATADQAWEKLEITWEKLIGGINDPPLRTHACDLLEELGNYQPPEAGETKPSIESERRLYLTTRDVVRDYQHYKDRFGIECSISALPLATELVRLAYAKLAWIDQRQEVSELLKKAGEGAREKYAQMIEQIPDPFLAQGAIQLFTAIHDYRPPEEGENRADGNKEYDVYTEVNNVATRYVMFNSRFNDDPPNIKPIVAGLFQLAIEKLEWIEQAESVHEDCTRAYQVISEELAAL